MTILLNIHNKYTIVNSIEHNILIELTKITSYLVSGHKYTPSFKAHKWDGRERLLKYHAKEGYRFPTGLLKDVVNKLTELNLDFKINDLRKKPINFYKYIWDGLQLRDYQQKAVNKIIKKDLYQGRGILKMPIRSGKTRTAAAIIKELGVKTLFIVPSQMLLHQTQKSLSIALQTNIGLIGDSNHIEKNITVATIQTLTQLKNKKKIFYEKIINNYDCVIFDECHHLKGNSWHNIFMDFDSFYKIGLSATAFLDNEKENEKGVIWLKACCGNIRIDVSTSQLIENGYLIRPEIILHKIDSPVLINKSWSISLRNQAIYENDFRNKKIVELTKKYSQTLQVLIITNRLNQVSIISKLLENNNIKYHSVTGKEKSEQRSKKIKEFVNCKVSVLIGTVFGEGIDIPEIECVINAEGGKDIKSTIQRMRCLTPNKGKTKAIFIDFMDLTNSYLANHSQERLSQYRQEKAFQIKIA